MAVIGISCDNNSISYVVVDGKPDSPKILECETYPLRQIEKGKLLDATNNRIKTLISNYTIERVAILVVDKIFGKGHNTDTHPVKHQIEGCIIYKFFEETIPCIEYNRNSKLVSELGKKLKKSVNYKPSEIEKFIKEKFDYICTEVTNKDQREALAVALTQL